MMADRFLWQHDKWYCRVFPGNPNPWVAAVQEGAPPDVGATPTHQFDPRMTPIMLRPPLPANMPDEVRALLIQWLAAF